MDEAAYQIVHETPPGSVRVTVRGFWTLELVDIFMAEMTAETARYREQAIPLSILIDALTMKPQPVENGHRTMTAWQQIIDQPDDRAAIVVASALTTMQFKRLYETERCRICGSEEDARAWLADQRDGQA